MYQLARGRVRSAAGYVMGCLLERGLHYRGEVFGSVHSSADSLPSNINNKTLEYSHLTFPNVLAPYTKIRKILFYNPSRFKESQK